MVKKPYSLVMVPAPVSRIPTLAPINVSPLEASLTIPDMEILFWADKEKPALRPAIKKRKLYNLDIMTLDIKVSERKDGLSVEVHYVNYTKTCISQVKQTPGIDNEILKANNLLNR
jgi:hypothetical protein